MAIKKFLIVDDDNDDRELFTEALLSVSDKTGYFHASDGCEALEILDNNKNGIPDIIFLDINMPVMSGWECLTKLKSTNSYQAIPIIIYSTSSVLRDKLIAKDLGAHCFVTKMYDFKKLKKMIEIVIDNIERQSLDKICESIYKGLLLN